MTFQLQTDKNPFQFHIMFIGMNPIKDGAYNRTKENIKDIRHVYLDLDRNGEKLSMQFETRPKSRPRTLSSTAPQESVRSFGESRDGSGLPLGGAGSNFA
jgi:hypothetical protein